MKFFASKFGKCVCGSISIMLAVILTGVLSLAALMVECGRYMSAKQLLEEITMSSAYSMLANYDKTLQSRFGLFGLQPNAVSDAAYTEYLEFNADQSLDDSFIANDTSKYFNSISGRFDLKYDLANANVLKRQILEYSKFRAPMTMATDMLNIEEMLDNLKEQILEAVPGLETMLDVCDAVIDVMEALKSIYSLYKNILKLDTSIDSTGDLKGALQKGVGTVWETVESLYTDEEWNTADPTYIDSYNAFEKAINDKITYMKKNSEPPDPGPAPTSNLTNLESAYNSAKTKKENLSFLFELLNYAKENDFCGENGIKKESEKIADVIADESLSSQSSKKRFADYALTENSTRKDLFKAINKMLENWLGSSYKMTSFNKTTLQSTVETVEGKKNTAVTAFLTAQSNYNLAKSAHAEYNNKKAAKEKYENDISNFNKTIDDTKKKLDSALTIVSQDLSSYQEKISSISSTLDGARKALEKLEEKDKEKDEEKNNTSKETSEKKENSSQKKKEGLSDEFNKTIAEYLSDEVINIEKERSRDGLEFCNGQKELLATLNVDEINQDYIFAANFSQGRISDKSNPYYLSSAEATMFIAALQGLAMFDNVLKTDIGKLFASMKAIIKLLNPVPVAFSLTCTVNLNDSTSKILPSKINGGDGTNETSEETDIEVINKLINDARQELGGLYQQDVDSVDPAIRLTEGELMNEISTKIDEVSMAMIDMVSVNATGLLNPGLLFVVGVVKMMSIISNLITIVKGLIFIVQHIGEAIKCVLASLGENILLNQYALMMFPHRMNEEIDGLHCESRVLAPDRTKTNQTFSGAHVEYIIKGSNSEKINQTTCFFSIFFIRVINNIFNIIKDADVMNIISGCSVFAPLVFVVWLYLESNIDMNMLVLLGMEVPLIKENLFLSINNLKNKITKITDVFTKFKVDENTTDEQIKNKRKELDEDTKSFLKMKGMFDMEYGNYLWIYLFFVPNHTKVMRMADLIQMEMRFTEVDSGKSAKFLMSETHTYVRATSTATFNSILPIMSMGSGGMDAHGLTIETVKYVGF